jgi:type IV fimbrial biogenesis protein FimT
MKREAGFTLTELMVVAAIVAILLAIGVPSYRYITTSYRMSSEVNNLLGDLMYARGEALKEGQYVTVCISSNGTGCTGGGGAWQNGWVVFSNPNQVAANPLPVGSILRVQAPFSGNPADSFGAVPAVTSVTYNREGFASTPGGGFPLATLITLRNPGANAGFTRCLSISAQGTLYTETPATSVPAGACN